MQQVEELEKRIAEFFGAPYAVAADSCTHGIELVLRMLNARYILSPKRTYLSVPMLARKLSIELRWSDQQWEDYYELYPKVYDAAVLWRKDSYLEGTFMVISCQKQKHLSVGRLGFILTDNQLAWQQLKCMSYDGRHPDIPWRQQNIRTQGYHYYVTPETAEIALSKLPEAILAPARRWDVSEWPDLTKQMDVFK